MKLLVLVVLCFFGAANAQIRWMPASNGHVPTEGIRGGNMEGQIVFVCRFTAAGDLVAGKLNTLDGECIVANRGGVHRSRSYDVAFGRHNWSSFRGGSVPRQAVLVGFTSGRVATFACQANHFNRVLPGRMVNGACFLPSHGLEHRYTTFNLLLDPSV